MDNGFNSLHPFVIFFYYVAVGFLSMYFRHPLFLGTIVFILVLVTITHDGGKTLKKWLPIYIAMTTVIIILNPFLVSRGTNILFYFRGKQVTVEATMYGVVMSLSILAILIMFLSFNLILNGNKFLYIFSRILPRTAFLTMIAIRFVPLLRDRLEEITTVQRVRQMTISSGPLKERVQSGMLIIQVLFTWSLEEAIQTADSMKARGYGIGEKTSYIPYTMQKRDWSWLIIIVFLLIICVAGGLLGYGKIVIYPQLGTLHLYPIDWLVYCCTFIIIAFPLIVEGREHIVWK